MISWTAIYVMWLREMKRWSRSKSRVFGSLAMPIFFMAFLGLGFNRMAVPGVGGNIQYMSFLVPGILGMTLLFSSTMQGMSVLWDKEFGFLKEILVAPVSRISLVLGRIAGGITTSMIQSMLILLLSLFLGFRPERGAGILFALLFMLLIGFTFIGLGLIFASRMKDMQGFSIVMNFIVFPLFFLSGALYPLGNLPAVVRMLSFIDPLTFGIDGLRWALIGVSTLPPALDAAVLAGFSVLMVSLGAYSFEKSEAK